MPRRSRAIAAVSSARSSRARASRSPTSAASRSARRLTGPDRVALAREAIEARSEIAARRLGRGRSPLSAGRRGQSAGVCRAGRRSRRATGPASPRPPSRRTSSAPAPLAPPRATCGFGLARRIAGRRASRVSPAPAHPRRRDARRPRLRRVSGQRLALRRAISAGRAPSSAISASRWLAVRSAPQLGGGAVAAAPPRFRHRAIAARRRLRASISRHSGRALPCASPSCRRAAAAGARAGRPRRAPRGDSAPAPGSVLSPGMRVEFGEVGRSLSTASLGPRVGLSPRARRRASSASVPCSRAHPFFGWRRAAIASPGDRGFVLVRVLGGGWRCRRLAGRPRNSGGDLAGDGSSRLRWRRCSRSRRSPRRRTNPSQRHNRAVAIDEA